MKTISTEKKARLLLILGGARSGKSSFAEHLAQRSKRQVAFIATATAYDDDMRERIARHRATRSPEWKTIEEPLSLSRAVSQAANSADIILLDCMTLWLSNWLLSQEQGNISESLPMGIFYDPVLAEIEELLATIGSLEEAKTLIFVSNEVGLGIVPAYALGRNFRDLLGVVNQRLATTASNVYFMIAGIAVDIKRLQQEISL